MQCVLKRSKGIFYTQKYFNVQVPFFLHKVIKVVKKLCITLYFITNPFTLMLTECGNYT